MKKLFLGTHNKAKLKEFKKYFSQFLPQIKLITPFDLKINSEPEETGKTFAENALIKAKFYAKKTNMFCLSDDGGFEIKALNNEPGVLSKRWPGYEATDQELINLAIKKLKNVPLEKRGAQLRAVVVIVNPEAKLIIQEGEKVGGIIAEKPALLFEKGYPYRAVLWLPQFKKFYQGLTEKEHEIVNHRKKIIKRISALIF